MSDYLDKISDLCYLLLFILRFSPPTLSVVFCVGFFGHGKTRCSSADIPPFA